MRRTATTRKTATKPTETQPIATYIDPMDFQGNKQFSFEQLMEAHTAMCPKCKRLADNHVGFGETVRTQYRTTLYITYKCRSKRCGNRYGFQIGYIK